MVRTIHSRSVAIPVRFKRDGTPYHHFLFCLSVAPLSRSLRAAPGIVSSFQRSKVTHLLYMDDLKLYASSKSRLEEVVRTAEKVSGELEMSLGLRKCAVLHMTMLV